jgi:hypothetical protein
MRRKHKPAATALNIYFKDIVCTAMGLKEVFMVYLI